jgi:hypothetical protein
MSHLAKVATVAAVLAFVAFLLCLAVGSSAIPTAPGEGVDVAEWEHGD